MERFQNTTRHTEMLPMIPINVVIPSKIPMIITMPDSGILRRGNVAKGSSCEPDRGLKVYIKIRNAFVLNFQGKLLF